MNVSFVVPRLAAMGALACATCTAFAGDLTISEAPPTSVKVGTVYEFSPNATCVGAIVPHFEIENAPPWASFQAFAGRLSGSPSAADVGVYPGITISITDGQSRASLPAFSIFVSPADGSRILAWLPPTQNEDGSPLTDLAGYYIYEGPTADALVPVAVADPAASHFVLGDSGANMHYFAITALNTNALESPLSAIISDQYDGMHP